MPRLLLVAGAAVILMAMTGCVDPSPPVTPSPTPSATPVFASEEEALAAAEAAYREYLAVSDAILQDGGVNGERIAPLVTPDELEDTLDGFRSFEDLQRRSVGATKFDSMTIARLDDAFLDVYVCLDVGQVRILDQNGADVTVLDRQERLPLQVGFERSGRSLLVARSESWTGDNFC
jgi:hypothetical protein